LVFLLPSATVLLQATRAQVGQPLPCGAPSVHFITSDQAEEEQLADCFTFSVPSQSIAPRACGQAVLRMNSTAFVTLDHVVDFPVAAQVAARPSPQTEDDRIAAKVAMPAGPLPDFP
jgi:hypothetical protein